MQFGKRSIVFASVIKCCCAKKSVHTVAIASDIEDELRHLIRGVANVTYDRNSAQYTMGSAQATLPS